MSLPRFSRQGSLFSVDNLLGNQFAADDRYRLFAERIHPLLVAARPQLEAAYCLGNGRPGIEPVLLLGVSLLQFMERCPDRQAMEHLKYHLGWKLALGRDLRLEAFDPTTLVIFRQRLIGHEQAKVAFDAVLDGLREAGLILQRGRRRLDSTHVLGLVAKLSALELLRETTRLALLELAKVEGRQRPPFWSGLWERYVENKLDYRMEEMAFKAKQLQAGEDMSLLLAWAKEQGMAAQGKQMQLLARVLEENFQTVAGKLELHAQPAGATKNPHDPEATWSTKGHEKKKDWIGYKVQVEETVPDEPSKDGEPTAAFITAMETQAAIGGERAGLAQVEVAEQESGLEPPDERHLDAGYVSAQLLKEAADAGRELVGPAPESPGRNRTFKSDAFDVEIENRKATCPAGQSSSNCSRLEEQATGKVNFRFEWGPQCRGCPWHDQCVAGDQGHRTLVVGEHHDHLQKRRREQKTEAFQKRMRQRNAIEGTHSELVRGHGLRKARYRGLPKQRLQNYFIGAAANAKRWIARLRWQMKQALKPATECVAAMA
jgi:hypothetical protein